MEVAFFGDTFSQALHVSKAFFLVAVKFVNFSGYEITWVSWKWSYIIYLFI